jgi:hypothetical protein
VFLLPQKSHECGFIFIHATKTTEQQLLILEVSTISPNFLNFHSQKQCCRYIIPVLLAQVASMQVLNLVQALPSLLLFTVAK